MDTQTNIMSSTVTLTVRGKTIEVRELSWRDYLRAIKQLTGSTMKLLGGDKSKNGGTVTALTLNRDNVIEAIGEQEELVAWAIGKSTELTPEEINQLSGRDVIPIIQAIVDLNLSEEVVGPGKKLAGRMGQVFGLKLGSAKSSITSSRTATDSATPSDSPSGN